MGLAMILELEMGMQLNVKSHDAYRLASELTQLTGESLTAAVTLALRERLEREQKARALPVEDPEKLAEELLEIGRRCAAHMRGPLNGKAMMDELYGPDGLPI
jgi:antitoxin VapB